MSKSRTNKRGFAYLIEEEENNQKKIKLTAQGRFIAWGTALGAIISGIISLLTFILITVPSANEKTLIDRDEFKLRLIYQALNNEESIYRANSLQLLISAGLLEDPTDTTSMSQFIEANKDSIPKWTKLVSLQIEEGKTKAEQKEKQDSEEETKDNE